MLKKDIINSNIEFAGMYEVKISTEEKPIVGTFGLAYCVGVLIYDRKNKIAIAGHSGNNWMSYILKLLDSVPKSCEEIEYMLIPGYYSVKENYFDTLNNISNFFEKINGVGIRIKKMDVIENAIQEFIYESEGKNIVSNGFLFDSKTGKFLCDINEVNYEENIKLSIR